MVAASNKCRRDLVSARTNELKTSSSLDRGPTHCCGWTSQRSFSANIARLTRKLSGNMLSTLMISRVLLWSSSDPKLGPPLRGCASGPPHRLPCTTPARNSSSSRYRLSWNRSFTLELTHAACNALPIIVWV